MKFLFQEECHNILNTQAKKLVVFVFTAEWCPHSIQLKTYLETLAKEDQHVVITLIDIDDDEDLVPFYSLYAVPSYYFFRNQEEIGIQVGGDFAALRTCIRKYKRVKETDETVL
ncbi:unnamed protein product [Rodentolepis nana]|uniref:Thioredoxin domain-containing protein n=1 Tax=Rodentolepis nana TaxID=102285 RepID=A0A0R3TRN8_RODNA|nr:unnamed protein product [Rodentolepis nana]